MPRVRSGIRRSRVALGHAVPVRRLAVVLVFAGVFFAGATVSAFGSETAIDVTSGDASVSESTSEDATTTAATTSETTVGDPTPPPPGGDPPTSPPPDGVDATPSDPAPPASSPPPNAAGPVFEPLPGPRIQRQPEIEGPVEAATVWLWRSLPDPTPPAKRLDPNFARDLRAAATAARVQWSLVLAVLRAGGNDGAVPASSRRLARLSERLSSLGARHHVRRAVLVLVEGDADDADKIMALARYNRAVGLRALVTGLAASTERLERRILRDPRIDVYAGGRADLQSGRIDVRVLVLVRYLRVTFRQVTVSSLRTGHRFFSRPGVPSAHVFGLAVDITALGHVPIYGHQGAGSLTERAVRAILLLPTEVQPLQVISLLGLGGPSFPLADHHDHIHVGY
jgi:hypothetical protein